ncbi:MAG: 16S rRNA (uracil(1498)-N(3))-methyltransferase [Vitreoscilla sp.]|nr:16S rRNA (uracil(1498)-N(3))-methyltransferase [Burkholderiales bacterium]MBP6338470.1 16S rRNA (uracil(1498)-N(3))-methyltransferase [Vitreoscilla sp.]MBP6675863.1 16S rRNA (uracil(1498)-N(3))-methyltransferase [Vitreoscilla sp.]
MPARLYLPLPLHEGAAVALPAEAARHVQVLRLQPGHAITLFNGDGQEWRAEVTRMGRHDVDVVVRAQLPSRACELSVAVTLALGMPANERMDALVEKATELGVAHIQPLQCARSVLKLQGERAERRQAHWQSVAQSAAEQSGRTRVPVVAPIATLDAWLGGLTPESTGARHVLSFSADAQPAAQLPQTHAITLLSGPEGGLDAREEALARTSGFLPLGLGPRVLRADTAPLAALAYLGLR